MNIEPSPFSGVALHAIGGLAAASFYLPFRRVRSWPWENAWIVNGVFSWIIAPLVAAFLLAPGAWSVLVASPPKALFFTWLFGFLWGIGGLMFGLSMRYLGIALGYAVALGLCAFFGTLIPPLFSGEIVDVASSRGGQLTLAGIVVCLLGIAMSGKAGLNKERELGDEAKQVTSREFNFTKGILVATGAGIMSACMAFGYAAGKPIAAIAVEQNVPSIWQNLPVLIVIMLGGFCLNFLWCTALIIRKRSFGVYFGQGQQESGEAPPSGSLAANYVWCAVAGVTWYLQFFFYGMGTTLMGKYEFSSWTLHMASIIIFSTIWGIILKEWRGTSPATHRWIAFGLGTLIISTIVVGWGNAISAG